MHSLANGAVIASDLDLPPPAALPGREDAKRQQQSPFGDPLGDSIDADWDAELGISEADQTEPLRLPLLTPQDLALHPTATTFGDSPEGKSTVVSNKLVVSALASPAQQDSQLEGIRAADLKGIRITSAVSENWDDDFLFQNDEDAVESTSAQPQPAGRHKGSLSTPGSNLLHLRDNQSGNDLENADSDDNDDVENWDDAFLWNADPQLTPSASTTSSLHNSIRHPRLAEHMRISNIDANPGSSRQLPADVRRRLDFGEGGETAKTRKRFSNASAASDATDFSARLAAQSDVDSDRPRKSQESGDFQAADSLRSVQSNALGLARNGRKDRGTCDARSDGSGDETETDTLSKEAAAATKSRPARRSLGAALGFDSSRKPTMKDSTATALSPSRLGSKRTNEAEVVGAKSHARTQSKSKLGALQRLSFSRSRVNVVNASSSSINEVPGAGEASQQLYDDKMNRSQASLLSQMSSSSNRSRRGPSPSSFEKSYAALRSTSFRRLLGRADKSTATPQNGVQVPSTPPSSPPRRKSELPQPVDVVRSPTRERPSTKASTPSMSPPSAWIGLRRSSEATPTCPKDGGRRRNSDRVQHESRGPYSWAVPESPSKPNSLSRDGVQCNISSMSSGEGRLDGSGRSNSRSSFKDEDRRSKASGDPRTAGLRRDFSSSNTLRGNTSFDAEDGTTRSGRKAAVTDAPPRQLQVAHRDDHARIRSSEALTDGSTGCYPYLGEKMLRGSDDRGSASRSVSASTAHSHTSNESVYGYRMRKQISVSSAADAHDSETSYGTSVGSSPGLSNLSSSGWLSYGKRAVTPSADTKDIAWGASVDQSALHEPLSVQQDHVRATSMPGSPIHLEKTLDGAMAKALHHARKPSSPDVSFSPSRRTTLKDGDFADSPLQPSRRSASRTIEPSPIKGRSSTADTSVPILPSASIGLSSVASPKRSATRRNSLSDLRIPSRISKAQNGIRNNITLVRDFAKGIEELKMLKASYMDQKLQAPLATSDVEERVQNWLECADVLIGLGEGRSESDSAARVETLSHTPLSARVESRRTTFSDVSSYTSPQSPLEGSTSRQSSVSGARSTSGTSQGTTSTTDGARSVDVQRELDILSAILGGTRMTPTMRSEARSHGRFQSETYSRDELPDRNPDFLALRSKQVVPTSSGETSIAWSNLATPDRSSFDDRRNGKGNGRPKHSERPFNTAPIISGGSASRAEVAPLDVVDVGDVNRSAKRRLRSASRAGLQGLRELLKVFKGTAADDNAAGLTSKATGTTEADTSRDDAREDARHSLDAGAFPSPTSKPKRKSLNLKRRSFLRSRTSLESMQAGADVPSAQEATPPLPSGTEGSRYALSSSKERRKQGPSPSKSSLDITWEAGSSAERSLEAKQTKAARRISLQSALSTSKRRSVDLVQPAQPRSTDSRTAKQETLRRPSLAVRQQGSTDPRRASTSVDSLHPHWSQHPPPQQRSAALETPMVPKLALRPEAMPGLLVYVQATKQHLQMAIDELGPPMPSRT